MAVLRERKPEHNRRHPRGDELVLVVEVADTSAAFDLTRKAELYANSGVPEYWVVDLPRRLVVRQREPRDGKYRLVDAFAAGAAVPLAEHSIPVDDILPQND
jgi:Uma2 family endonuclease